MIYLLDYYDSDLSTKPVLELAGLYLAAKSRKDETEMTKLESVLLTRMEQTAYRDDFKTTNEILGTYGLSDKVMLRGLELLANAKMTNVDKLLEVLDKANSLPVKKASLNILADRGYLHTLEEIQQKGVFSRDKKLASALHDAINKCVKVCLEKGHITTLSRRGLRFATCSG